MKNDKTAAAFDKFWSGFEDLWSGLEKRFDRVFDEALPPSTEVKTTIRVSLTKQQLMSLIVGDTPRLMFKVKDDVAIQVEMKP